MRYGTMRDNVLSIEAVLADGTLAHFGRIGGNLNDVPAPLRPLAKDLLAIGAREAGRDRRALSQGAAPRRRLQSRRAGARQERHQSRACAGRLRRHARLFHPHRIEAVAAARPPRGRRLPLRQLPRGDGCRPAHRASAADRGGADRPHHDRAGARDPDLPADAGQIRARDAGRHPAGRVRRGRITRKTCAGCSKLKRPDRRSRLRLGQERATNGAAWSRCSSAESAGRDHRRAHLRPQHHDVDEGGGQTGLLRRGLRGAARASRRLHRAADARFSRSTAPAAPGTRMPAPAACMCARCSICGWTRTCMPCARSPRRRSPWCANTRARIPASTATAWCARNSTSRCSARAWRAPSRR